SLAEIVRTCFPTRPDAADEVDGCVVLPGALAVTRPELAHGEIAGLLEEIRYAGHPSLPRPKRAASPAETAIQRGLARRADLNYNETPLAEVLDDIGRRYHLNVVVNHYRLRKQG